jgi:hypothetical protein
VSKTQVKHFLGIGAAEGRRHGGYRARTVVATLFGEGSRASPGQAHQPPTMERQEVHDRQVRGLPDWYIDAALYVRDGDCL